MTAPTTGAQEPPEEAAKAEAPDKPDEPAAFPIGELTVRADTTKRFLADSRKALEPDRRLQAIAVELPDWQTLVDDSTRETEAEIATGASTKTLQDLERSWVAREVQLADWQASITERSAEIDRERAEIETLRTRWEKTLAVTEDPDQRRRIEAVLEDVDVTANLAGVRTRWLVEVQGGIADVERDVASTLRRVRATQVALRRQLLEPESPPIWDMVGARPTLAEILDRLRRDASRDWAATRAYLQLNTGAVMAQLALLLLTYLVALGLRRRVRRWGDEDPELGHAREVFERPAAVAIFLVALLTPTFQPLAPAVVFDFAGLMLLYPAFRLLPPLVPQRSRRLVYALLGFFVASMVGELIEAAPFASRMYFALELAFGTFLLAWLLRPARLAYLAELGERLTAVRLLGFGARVALVGTSIAFVANLFGYYSFAQLLGDGILAGIFLGVVFYGVYRVFQVSLAVGLRSSVARKLRMLRVAADQVSFWILRITRIVLFLSWASWTLQSFAIRDDVVAGLRALLELNVEAGALDVSIGDVLAFVVTLLAAWYVSRFIRFVLEEDVYPRLTLERGIPNAISTTASYLILLTGFLVAAAAAGLDLSRLTLLAGAFGVGIGFGLQDVVNNFVSGLILLFERPIQVGDTVETGQLLGDVRRIGPRSSTVRTFDGAEVIVPNGLLISNQVINWTLSDRRRRVIVNVGVAYGTDPERVLQILRAVAAEDEAILADPEPLVIFTGFKDDSLEFELRCWIPRYETGLSTRSELWVSIYRKLREAGIEIPFPQRDLHVRTVAPEAQRALAAIAREDGPDGGGGS